MLGSRRRSTDADALVANVVRHGDLDLGQVLLHLLLDHLLHKDPALLLKLAVAAVDDAEDALAQRLLDLAHEAADLVEQLRLDVVAEAAVPLLAASAAGAGVAVELRIKGVAAEDLLERALEGVGQQLEQLLLDGAEDLAELETHVAVHLGEAGAQLVADDLGEAAAGPVGVAGVARLVAEPPRGAATAALVGRLLAAKEAAEALDEVLDLVFNLALDAVAEVARARVAAQPGLDVLEREARRRGGRQA
ncbi:hypothetical protein VDGD_21489 [Verticillium dahliae]|nr:hypothetical protein VDGD_21489 [Verticillium dahliae]